MSGGYFDFGQYKLKETAETLETIIRDNNKTVYNEVTGMYEPEYEVARDGDRREYLDHHRTKDEIRIFATTAKKLRILADDVHDIDWYLSADTGREEFKKDWMERHGKQEIAI